MYLSHLTIKNHPILKDVDFDFINHDTGKPYSIIAFVGENGCGKTTLLNEIFNYSKSQYIVDKDDKRLYLSTFLRQGQLYYSSMDHIKKLINGEEASYPSQSKELLDSPKTANTLLASSGINDVSLFHDKKIEEVFAKNEATFIPGGKVAKLIDGKTSDYDYDAFSSGQQELIFKLQTIRDIRSGTDFLLMDEPETSLHPRWQKIIIDYLISRINVDDEFKPQIFIATHSEKILESLINKKDTLIIRLFRDDKDTICTESISQMDLRLPKPTFAELDYVVFHIPSMDYHDQLLTRMADMFEVEAISDIDKTVRTHPLYSKQEYGKVWVGTTKFKVNTYRTLPVYIRNYFHHPKDGVAPSEEEVVKSIELLRTVIKKKIEE